MMFAVVAKRYGDQVAFAIEDARDSKEGYEKAKAEANRIFSYHVGEAGAPTVNIKPIPEEDPDDKEPRRAPGT